MATPRGGYFNAAGDRIPGTRAPVDDRFWSFVHTEPNSGCWIWCGARHQRGYGSFYADGVVHRAHRWAFEHFRGPVPANLVIDHRCRNPSCVNPDHLEPVTQRTNVLRGGAPAAGQHQQTRCVHGHALVGANVYTKPNGARQCKTCRRATDARRYRRKRGAV